MDPEDLNYEYVEGEGTPIVFIHGWLGSKKSWEKVRTHLDLEKPMLFYDQRCHGESECEEFDFDDLADDLNLLMKELNLQKPILIGHSMGGMVALKYLILFRSLDCILFGTCASTPEPENGSPVYFLDNYEEMDSRKWAEEITKNYVGNDQVEKNQRSVRQLMNANPTAVKSGLKSMIEYDIREDLRNVDNKLRVVHGKKDGAITRDKSEELADLIDSEINFLDASHLMISERPEESAKIIENFLNRY